MLDRAGDHLGSAFFFQKNATAVGLRENPEQRIENFRQNGLQVYGTRQAAGDFEHGFQLRFWADLNATEGIAAD